MLYHVKSNEEFLEKMKDPKVIIDFYADWCGPCQMLSPILEKLATELTDVTFLKVNTDELPALAGEFRVSSIPALFRLENGKMVKATLGYMPEPTLRKFITE